MTQPSSPPTVTLPVFGTVQRRWVYVSAAAVAVLVGYAYWSRARTSSAAGPGGVTYDPATGSVIAGAGGYVNPAPNAPPSDEVVVDDGVIRTDAQWSAAAVNALTLADWNQQFAATTIGKYLAGMTLTAAEADMVRAAWALVGYPPSAKPIVTAPGPPPPPGNPPPSNPPPNNPPPAMPAGYPLAPGTDLYHFVYQVQQGQLTGMPTGIPGYTWSVFQSLNPGVVLYRRDTAYGPQAPHNKNAIFAKIR